MSFQICHKAWFSEKKIHIDRDAGVMCPHLLMRRGGCRAHIRSPRESAALRDAQGSPTCTECMLHATLSIMRTRPHWNCAACHGERGLPLFYDVKGRARAEFSSARHPRRGLGRGVSSQWRFAILETLAFTRYEKRKISFSRGSWKFLFVFQ